MVIKRQIDDFGAFAFDVQFIRDQFASQNQGIDQRTKAGGVRWLNPEQFARLLNQHGARREGVAVLCKLVERIEQASTQTLAGISGNAHTAGDAVRLDEANAEDLIRQRVWIGLDAANGLCAVMVIDARRQFAGDAVLLKEDHRLALGGILGPGTRQFGRKADLQPFDLSQPFRVVVEDVDGIQPEVIDDPGGGGFADAAHDTAAEIAPDAFQTGGRHRLDDFSAELFAILGIVDPISAKLHTFTRREFGHGSDHGNRAITRFGVTDALIGLDFDDAVAIGVVEIRHPFDGSNKDSLIHVGFCFLVDGLPLILPDLGDFGVPGDFWVLICRRSVR